jgi:hypothetical protein
VTVPVMVAVLESCAWSTALAKIPHAKTDKYRLARTMMRRTSADIADMDDSFLLSIWPKATRADTDWPWHRALSLCMFKREIKSGPKSCT